MAFTVEEVIKRARDQHPSFTGETTPDATLFRQLDDLHKELVQKTLQWNSSLLVTDETISWPLPDFDAGHSFPAYSYIHGGDVVFADVAHGKRSLHIIPWERRYDPVTDYPAYFHAGTLYFAGQEDDWTGVDEIVVKYVPEVVDLTDLSSNPITPDRSRPVYTAELALFMAKRGNAIDENEPPALQLFRDDRDRAWKLYQEWCGIRESQAETTTWGEAW